MNYDGNKLCNTCAAIYKLYMGIKTVKLKNWENSEKQGLKTQEMCKSDFVFLFCLNSYKFQNEGIKQDR